MPRVQIRLRQGSEEAHSSARLRAHFMQRVRSGETDFKFGVPRLQVRTLT